MVVAMIGILTVQLLDGAFMPVNYEPLEFDHLSVSWREGSLVPTRPICRDLGFGCGSRHSHAGIQLFLASRLHSPSSPFCRSNAMDVTFEPRRCQPRVMPLHLSKESNTLQFDKSAAIPGRDLYPRDVIFCGEERIPFLRAAFGNNDNVDAKVTIHPSEQTQLPIRRHNP